MSSSLIQKPDEGDNTQLVSGESTPLWWDVVLSTPVNELVAPDSAEMLAATVDGRMEWAGLTTFAQTCIPRNSFSGQSDACNISEDEFAEWTMLGDQNIIQSTVGQKEETFVQQLLARPIPQTLIMDDEFLEWLEMDSMELLDREKQCISEKGEDEEEWSITPHAWDDEMNMTQVTER